VEICSGNGIECNTANLWTVTSSLVEEGQKFYKNNRHTYVYPPRFVHCWITRDNVNAVIREIDLLSIDLGGVDYWIWAAIEAIEPRVVVVEYQDIIGPDKSLTVPYKDGFDAYACPTTRVYQTSVVLRCLHS